MTNPRPASPRSGTAREAWRARSDLDLTDQQLRGITAFHQARAAVERLEAVRGRTRERRLDGDRRLEVLRRQHDALVQRAQEQLRRSGELRRPAPRRVVLAHRNAWFLDKVAGAVAQQGVEVLARVDNGADAVGIVVVEQPDLLLVEDGVTMVPGERVVREVREYSPGTLIAAHVAHGDRVGLFLEAGAITAFPRQVPPADAALGLLGLLDRRRTPRPSRDALV